MSQKTSLSILFTAACALALSAPARADIISTIGEFDQPFVFSTPASSVLGTFTFTVPTGVTVTGATISGTFGNEDVPGTTNVTALSDYFVDNFAIPVASCDNFSAPCAAGNPDGSPTPWSYVFTPTDLATLAPAFAAGSLDFDVTQNFLGSVQTGVVTLDIQATPEPTELFLLPAGLIGLVFWRFRSARSR